MQPGPYAAPPPKRSQGLPVWIIVVIVIAVGGVLFVGVLAALGIYGTRRYVQSAKTAEAKNTVGAIARGAQMAWERESAESGAHRFCASATSVPATVPAGKKHMPSVSTGMDFNTGDENTGWMCLKFSMTTPIYYQYHYHQGSGYLAPAVSPGADGFEAAARGDLDGNGTTSLFALTGKASGGVVTLSPTVHIENEFE